mmetsp:Transcript_12148/g.37027  ORF Transcript_12148/g.37027 Transcript_12148/m.37027 type:complete len:365 (-) Transcript_12148:242-1336(-)|eukprot:CAMPEP_0198733460 /NCGR_PEP_ID=MMETSP1475-20131203/45893_1 /TAXON_ID= ORGANISM="Unidentified sp., Strain CCMP1999" /NCGR_SAMPLE_ID=MMETSP1475 /ASSEMBLY_ACC=CAM_ASM_001111 /LENGTH=364 /DNA_ID=CAMNT_0044496765 /DNA_START=197 /DNA_END=1291 /DNA_ORIENTATION=-
MGRGVSWARDEEFVLCRAAISVGEDPLFADKKTRRPNYEGRLYDTFLELCTQQPRQDRSDPRRWTGRSPAAVIQAWRNIKTACATFHSCVKELQQQLGDDDVSEAALRRAAEFLYSKKGPVTEAVNIAKGKLSAEGCPEFQQMRCYEHLLEATAFQNRGDGGDREDGREAPENTDGEPATQDNAKTELGMSERASEGAMILANERNNGNSAHPPPSRSEAGQLPLHPTRALNSPRRGRDRHNFDGGRGGVEMYSRALEPLLQHLEDRFVYERDMLKRRNEREKKEHALKVRRLDIQTKRLWVEQQQLRLRVLESRDLSEEQKNDLLQSLEELGKDTEKDADRRNDLTASDDSEASDVAVGEQTR